MVRKHVVVIASLPSLQIQSALTQVVKGQLIQAKLQSETQALMFNRELGPYLAPPLRLLKQFG